MKLSYDELRLLRDALATAKPKPPRTPAQLLALRKRVDAAIEEYRAAHPKGAPAAIVEPSDDDYRNAARRALQRLQSVRRGVMIFVAEDAEVRRTADGADVAFRGTLGYASSFEHVAREAAAAARDEA